VENGEKSMKTTILWKSALVVSALLVFLFTILGEAAPMGEAGPQVATPPKATIFRPFSDFLDAQGTTDIFYPPVKDYVGWTDNVKVKDSTLFALVDYAGLANDFLQDKLGTRVDGFVIQSELADGRAQITVSLTATNALGFAQLIADINKLGFLNAPTKFGNKAQDVANGAEAAVGDCTFLVTFSISEPGAPLPDLVDVLSNKPNKFKPIDLSFIATIPGQCENGTRAVLHVDQEGPPGDKRGVDIVEIINEPCS
jgi:hypothetical protein